MDGSPPGTSADASPGRAGNGTRDGGGDGTRRFLVVNTAETDRELCVELARGGDGQTARVVLEAGGYASMTAPPGGGALSVRAETDAGAVATAVVRRPPMVVVRDRSVELC